ncbi:DNA-binding transcriptional regulator, LysR family [Pseudomonas segetis]|uniref:DNA-binding transcriptional regulator, LysR family n=2 Tax=Pseudomonas segetis TaxID=298908 RepID=A0A239IV61_9PSED|nr:DNA-binding transcriptional regulator, LysR family [Pseudomonas segetis]
MCGQFGCYLLPDKLAKLGLTIYRIQIIKVYQIAMDRILAMQVFSRIVELGAFGKAADSLGLPRATVTQMIKQLESHLGVQLLQRTTRQVRATLDGQAYYQRCVHLLADIEEAESFFSQTRNNPQGQLRIDLPASLGHRVIIPAMTQFCARYPKIELIVGSTDRPVDLVREGVDCVVRAGQIHDLGLVARPLAQLPQITCASAEYLSRFGTPQGIAELVGHRAVNYASALNGRVFPFEFQVDGKLLEIAQPGTVTVNNAEAYVAACEAGLGIIQAPYYHLHDQLANGSMVEILSQHRPPAMPLTALYPPHRQLSRRVRVWVDWLVELFSADQWAMTHEN